MANFISTIQMHFMRKFENLGLLILRIINFSFILHGLHKLEDPAGFIGGSMANNPLGAIAPGLFGWLVMLGEVLLPIAILLGIFTRLAGLLQAVLMLFIIFCVNIPNSGLIGETGAIAFETSLFFVALGLAAFFFGAGKYSVDALLERTFHSNRS